MTPTKVDDLPVRVYLSGVVSRTHLVYAASYLRHLLQTGTGPVVLVNLGLGSFMGRSTVDAGDLASLLPADDRLRVYDGLASAPALRSGERLTYLSVGAPGIKPYLRLRTRHSLRRLTVVVVDEGLGTYGTWRTRRDSWRREGGREPWPTIRALAVHAARRLLTDQRWPLYLRHDGEWQVNDDVAREFLRVGPRPGPEGRRTVVVLSQPWVELGLVDAPSYVSQLEAVGQACAARGLDLVVKPHPAEDPRRYAPFRTTARSLPAELDPDVLAARGVVGVSSSALLNLAALHGLPALRLHVPELAHLDEELAPDQRSLLDTFLPPPAGPDTILERLP